MGAKCEKIGKNDKDRPGLFGGANGGLLEGSRQGLLPGASAASVLVLTVRHSAPRLRRRPSNTSRWRK